MKFFLPHEQFDSSSTWIQFKTILSILLFPAIATVIATPTQTTLISFHCPPTHTPLSLLMSINP